MRLYGAEFGYVYLFLALDVASDASAVPALGPTWSALRAGCGFRCGVIDGAGGRGGGWGGGVGGGGEGGEGGEKNRKKKTEVPLGGIGLVKTALSLHDRTDHHCWSYSGRVRLPLF